MKIKKIIFLVALLITMSTNTFSQKAEPVHAVIVTGKDSAWYAKQAELWEQEVKRHPESEDAWRNLFNAKYYLKFWYNSLQKKEEPAQSVLTRMEKAIPESFTYNYCRYKVSMASPSEYAERALKQIPENVDLGMVDGLLGYLWRRGADADNGEYGKIFNKLLKMQYEGNYYPEFALRYSYNQLEGLPQNAIYIGNGDLDLFPKIMIQRAMGLHTDKTIVVQPFLFLEDYRDSICTQLGIAPFRPTAMETTDAQHPNGNNDAFVKYLSEQTGRPLYFEASLGRKYNTLSTCLYREALLLRYSPTPYNNVEASLQTIEKYHLEYLTEPRFHSEYYWKGSEQLQINYAILLANYIKSYEERGNKKRAIWLENLLRASITNTQLDDAQKQTILKFIDHICP